MGGTLDRYLQNRCINRGVAHWKEIQWIGSPSTSFEFDFLSQRVHISTRLQVGNGLNANFTYSMEQTLNKANQNSP